MRKFADMHKRPTGVAVARPAEPQAVLQMPYFLKMRSPMHTPLRLAAQKSERQLGLNVNNTTINYLQVQSPRPGEMNMTSFVSSPRPDDRNFTFVSSPRPAADRSIAKTVSQNRLNTKAKMSCLFNPQYPPSQNHHYPLTDRTLTTRNNSSKILHPLDNELNMPKLLCEIEAKSIVSIDDSHDQDRKQEDESIIKRFDRIEGLTSPRYNRR
jgi:hypothetical protein